MDYRIIRKYVLTRNPVYKQHATGVKHLQHTNQLTDLHLRQAQQIRSDQTQPHAQQS